MFKNPGMDHTGSLGHSKKTKLMDYRYTRRRRTSGLRLRNYFQQNHRGNFPKTKKTDAY